MCRCAYVLMHVCSYVLMCLYAYVLMCEYINLSMFKYVWVLMCSTKLSTALSSSKFYHFFGRKRSGITPFFKTSKHLFQPRFHLSVSPDCKMCVRVTNTGKSPVFWCYKSRSRSINETWQSLMTIPIICFTIIVLLYLGIVTENNYICPAIHLLHK